MTILPKASDIKLDTVTLLTSPHRRAVKRHQFDHDGALVKTYGYDNIATWDHKRVPVSGLKSLLNILAGCEKKTSTVIIRGQHENESGCDARRKMDIFKDVAHHWVMLDMDDVQAMFEVDPTSRESLDSAALSVIRTKLPTCFHDADVIIQWSQSAGVASWERLRLHLWFWLERPLDVIELKAWYKSDELLREHTDLAMTSTNQVHYVGCPIFEGVEDPFKLRAAHLIAGPKGDVPTPTDQEIQHIVIDQAGTRKTRTPKNDGERDLFTIVAPLHSTRYGTSVCLGTINDMSDVDATNERGKRRGLYQPRHDTIRNGGARLGSYYAGGEISDRDMKKTCIKCTQLADKFRDGEGHTFLDGVEIGKANPERSSEKEQATPPPSEPKADPTSWIQTALDDDRVILNKLGNPNPRHLPTLMACLESYLAKDGGPGCRFDKSFNAIFVNGIRFNESADLSKYVAELSIAFNWVGDLYKPFLKAIIAIGFEKQHNSLAEAMPTARDKWIADGKVDRFNGFCARIFGGHHDKIDDVIMKKWFVGAAARAIKPGSEMSIVPLLRSIEGTGKTRFARAVGEFAKVEGERRMITLPAGAPLGSDAAVYQFISSWIVELGELSSLNRARQEDAKQVLSEQVDAIIPKYQVTQARYYRQNVFIGTTNVHNPLKDPTGSRRFHVIEITKVDVDALSRDLDLIIGQAVYLFEHGEQTWLTDDETDMQRNAASDYKDEDSLSLAVLDLLKRNDGMFTTREYERELHETKDNGINASELRQFHTRIHEFLFSKGWSNRKKRPPLGRRWRRIEQKASKTEAMSKQSPVPF